MALALKAESEALETTGRNYNRKAAPTGAADAWEEFEICSEQEQNIPPDDEPDCSEQKENQPPEDSPAIPAGDSPLVLHGWGDGANWYDPRNDLHLPRGPIPGAVDANLDPMPDPADDAAFTAWAQRQQPAKPKQVIPAPEKTPAPQLDVMAALSKTAKRAIPSIIIDAAKQLEAAVEAHRTHMEHSTTPTALSLRNSIEELDRLTRLGNPAHPQPIPFEEWKPVLDWYCLHMADRFVPHAFSGGGFRAKYQAIVAAQKRAAPKTKATPEAPHIDADAMETLEAIQRFNWPPKARKALPVAVQDTWTNYRKITAALQQLPEVERIPIGNGKVRIMSWGLYRTELHARAPLDPTKWWERAGRAIYSGWEGHNTLALSLSLDNDALLNYWEPPLQKYSGNPMTAQQLIDRITQIIHGGELQHAG